MAGKMKKMLSAVISLAMILSALPAAVIHAEGNAMLWEANFDGNDDTTYWTFVNAGSKSSIRDYSEFISNGNLVGTPMTMSYGNFAAEGRAPDADENGLLYSDAGQFPVKPFINIANKEDIIFETRMKIDFPKSATDDDGYLLNTTDNKFIVIQGESTNYQINLALRNGVICYGGTQNDNTVNTGEKFRSGVWYVFREYINTKTKMMKLYFADETGHEYEGEWGQLSYGLTLTDIYSISMTRQLTGNMTTYIDYIKLWDNSLLDPVSATYANGTPLDGAKGLDTEFSANISFNNAITAADADRISVSNGAVYTKQLSADGKTLTLGFSELEAHTKYTVDVPAIGLNASAQFSFTTMSEPWYLFRAEFDGEDDISNWASFTAGCGYRDEEDTNHTSYGAVQSDGTLMVNNMNTGYGWWGAYFGEGDDALKIPATKENIFFEAKFKLSSLETLNLARFFGTRTADQTTQYFLQIRAESGTVSGVDKNGAAQSISLSQNTWYTLNVNLNYAEGKAYYTVSDNSGNKASFMQEFVNRSLGYYNLTYFAVLDNYPNINQKYIDYVRVWDGDKLPKMSVVYDSDKELDGAVISGNTLDAQLIFPFAVTSEDVAGVSINNGAEIEKSISDDGRTVNLAITGLSARNTYTLSVPAIGDNGAKDITFTTSDEAYYLYRAEFDGKDDSSMWGKTANGFTYFSDVEKSAMLSDGKLKYTVNNTSYQNFGLQFADSTLGTNAINLSGKENVVFEQAFKFTSSDGSLFKNRLIQIFDEYAQPGQLRNADVCINVVSVTDGGNVSNDVQYGGSNGNLYSLDMPLLNNVDYVLKLKLNYVDRTYSFELTGSNGDYKKSQTVPMTDQQNVSRTIGRINTMYTGESSKLTFYQDYIRLWDDDLVPGAEITYGSYSEKLDGAGSVKNGETVTITFPNAVDASAVNGALKLDGNVISGTLSADNKVYTAQLNGIGTRSFHTLTLDQVGMNKALSASFRSADEAKYLFRAEFDGYDDDTLWYLRNSSNNAATTNAFVSDGMFSYSFTSSPQEYRYRAFTPVFRALPGHEFVGRTPRASQALDCTGKKNVTIETRLKVGEGELDGQFLYLGDNIAMLKIGQNGELRYDGNGGTGGDGQPFMVNDAEFIITPDIWYTITMRFDFVSQKYSVSVDDGRGNIANSGVLNFIYNAKKYEICDLRYQRMLSNNYAPLYIDYLRITDDDHGKASVTYGNNIALDGAATVGINDTYTINADAVSGDVSDIALYDENGGSVAVSCVQNGNTVTVTPSALSYNTKYTLIIPSDVIGTESDQTVTYTTVWDENAEFVYPAGYSRNDALNVVFFGGSITQQDGWRVYTTNWIKDKFPNANAYSAAIGGTGAEYGWTRLKRDVISKDPDIVFVEYAVNDSTNPKTAQYMESIVRNLNALPKPPVIIFVYTTVLDFNTNTYAIAEHERVAKAYGIPSISIHDYVKSLYDTDPQFASDWDNKLYLPDSTHPTISGTYNGSKIYGDYVTALMGSDSGKYFVKPKKNNMVSALTEYKDYVYDYDITDITLSTVGESYEYSFSGEELVVEYGRGPSKGKFSIEVDGVLIHQSLDAYIQSSVPNMCMPVYGLTSGRHTAKITVLGKNSASSGNEVSLKCMFFADKPSAEFKTPVFDAQALAAGVPLNISYAYTTSMATPVTLWAAAYDTNGKLTSITSLETQTEATGSELSLTLTMTPKAGDTSVKAFIWESLETMKPLAPANELN